MKIMKILTIVFLIILINSNVVFAGGVSVDDVFNMGEDWINTGKDAAVNKKFTMDTSALKDGSDKLYNFFLAIATVVAVIVGAILGLQYMMAGIEEKVQVKQSLFPYMISCIIVFGSIGIWRLVVVIMTNF